MRFSASVITGSGRGKGMGTPTLNLDLADIPGDLKEGIYACKVIINDAIYDAAMHYGPRPVHKDTASCEVHLLDETMSDAPAMIAVEIAAYLRPVQDFPSEAALIAQINDDIAKARGILETYVAPSEKTDS